MLIVAYPNEMQDSEFEFEYLVGGYSAEKEIWEAFGLGKDDEIIFYGAVGAVVFLIVLIVSCCILSKKRK